MSTRPKILYVMRDAGGCGYYRCQQPAEFMTARGFVDAKAVLSKPSTDDLMAADLVILQETGSINASNIGRFCIAHNIPFLAEFDDFIHHVSPHNLGGYGAWNPSTLFVHRAMELARASYGITVSTPQLAREYFPYNPTVYVIPNYLDKDVWDLPVIKLKDGKTRIGWMGGNAHADDLKMISKVIERLTKEYDGKVIFETMGMTAQELHGVFSIQHTPETSCEHCGHQGVLHHLPGDTQQNYPAIVASRAWDIALAPVVNNSFGNAKSDLKLKEYAAAGIPMVASRIAPYVEAQKAGCDVLLADTYEEWYTAIKALIEDPLKRDDIARRNREWVSGYWIQDNAQRIFEIYRQIMASSEQYLGRKENRPQP